MVSHDTWAHLAAEDSAEDGELVASAPVFLSTFLQTA
jgi:hypothetical protein